MVGAVKAACGAVAIFILVWVPMAHADQDELASRAKIFIEGLTETVVSELTDPTLPIAEQEDRFREITRKHFAFKSIARWVLGGRHWKQAEAAQRERYLRLFEDLMVATYAHRFQGYSGEQLEIANTRVINDAEALVETRLLRAGADVPLRIDWRVRKTDDSFRIIDIMAEGLSMAQTQRAEFSSFLRSNDNDLEALMSNLKTRLKKARAGRASGTQEAASKS